MLISEISEFLEISEFPKFDILLRKEKNMTTFKKLKLIEKELGVETYKKTLERLPKRDRKNLHISLKFLLEEIIPKSDLDDLVEFTIRNYPMSNSELLSFIIEELIRQGAKIRGKKGSYDFLIEDDMWKKYEKSWYGWLNKNTKDSNIENLYIKKKIEMKLDFSSEVWDKVEIEQKKIISQKVKLFLEREPTKKVTNHKRYNISLTDIEPVVSTCNQEQKRLIEQIVNADSVTIKNMLNRNNIFFRCKEENQDFLMKVLPILYKKGFYEFLHTKLFPSLLTYNREKNYVKFKEANTLSNIGDDNYREIYHLLKSIQNPTKEESIDITTMLISNFKRSSINQENIDKEALLNTIITSIKHYKEAYEETNNYYPAINLMYMLKLLEILFPKEKVFLDYNLENIYNSTQLSIREDKRRGEDFNYYASISDIEFQILLDKYSNHQELKDEIANLLLELTPDKFLLERTVKQMLWFISLIEEFNSKVEKLLDTMDVVVEELEKEIYSL